jgi:hypothetical protein
MKNKLTAFVAAAVLGLALFTGSMSSPLQAASAKPYPLKTCVVSGNELGSMGKVISKTHGDQEIKFCCKPCVKKFDANPNKYLSKLK